MPVIKKVMSIFLRDEDGAVTVDWIALTAAILLLGMVTAFAVGSSVPVLADKLSSFLDAGGI